MPARTGARTPPILLILISEARCRSHTRTVRVNTKPTLAIRVKLEGCSSENNMTEEEEQGGERDAVAVANQSLKGSIKSRLHKEIGVICRQPMLRHGDTNSILNRLHRAMKQRLGLFVFTTASLDREAVAPSLRSEARVLKGQRTANKHCPPSISTSTAQDHEDNAANKRVAALSKITEGSAASYFKSHATRAGLAHLLVHLELLEPCMRPRRERAASPKWHVVSHRSALKRRTSRRASLAIGKKRWAMIRRNTTRVAWPCRGHGVAAGKGEADSGIS